MNIQMLVNTSVIQMWLVIFVLFQLLLGWLQFTRSPLSLNFHDLCNDAKSTAVVL
jgi:DNA-binding transcriptional regulator of glucitol operon